MDANARIGVDMEIKDKVEYEMAMERIECLIGLDPEVGSPEYIELVEAGIAVADYEDKYYNWKDEV